MVKYCLLAAAFIVGSLAASASSQDCPNGQCSVRSVPKKVVQVASQPVKQVASAKPVRKVLRFRPLRRLFGR